MGSWEPFERWENFVQDLGMFEAAVHPPVEPPVLPRLQRLLLAADGSATEPFAQALAEELCRRHGCSLHTVRGVQTAPALISAWTHQQADVLIIPVPYGGSDPGMRGESLGIVIDRLLVERPGPMLCVPVDQPLTLASAFCQRILLPLTPADTQVPTLIAWAFRLLQPGDRLDILGLIDQEGYQRAVPAGSVAEAELVRGFQRQIAGWVSLAQHHGWREGEQVHVEFRVGKLVEAVRHLLTGVTSLVLMGSGREATSAVDHAVRSMLLGWGSPVWVV
ncbi:MAG: hypothetical protein KatS3mg114_1378 [Planctomycetaceae bacterium]|nr:MAG: hypothetical protein KatS3mg114_1378 [Planctomycetaceae bacterium]